MAGNGEFKTALDAVLVKSVELGDDAQKIEGYDFSEAVRAGGVDYDRLLGTYVSSGFQASNFGQAVNIVNQMLSWKPSPEELAASENPDIPGKCVIFLGYTSNLISSGVREVLRFLAEHKLVRLVAWTGHGIRGGGKVDVIVTTAGGVEEDLIKCLAPTYLGDFRMDGKQLREQGLNRIGNLLVPNNNYCKFEDWLLPILDQMLKEQNELGQRWSPSKVIQRLGREIDDPTSVCYWASRKDIPIFCPALTDGSIGDMLFFHSFRNPGLVIDLVEDIREINKRALRAPKTGMIILGGGVVKHHICNANLMRNGADFAVYINTAQEFDGSDSGAAPDEAVSWGKIRGDAQKVKLCSEASLVFPLLVAQTFAKHLAPS